MNTGGENPFSYEGPARWFSAGPGPDGGVDGRGGRGTGGRGGRARANLVRVGWQGSRGGPRVQTALIGLQALIQARAGSHGKSADLRLVYFIY